MDSFRTKNPDINVNIGEIVLKTLLDSNVNSITNLNLRNNRSWFWDFGSYKERFGNVELLTELISKQACLQHLDIGSGLYSSNATKTVLKMISNNPSTHNKL